MSKKLLLAAGLIAFSASVAMADCPSFNGFSAGATVGFKVDTVKSKKEAKKFNVKETATYKVENKTLVDALKAAQALEDAGVQFTAFADADVNASTAAAATGIQVFKDAAAAKTRLETEILTPLETIITKFGGTLTKPASWTEVAVVNTVSAATVDIGEYKLGDVELNPGKALITGATPVGNTTAAVKTETDRFTYDGITKYIVKTYADSIYATTDSAPASVSPYTYTDPETNTQAHKQGATFGLKVGYGHSFGKFYLGADLFGEIPTGKVNVKDVSADKGVWIQQFDDTYTYTNSVVKDPSPSITLKTKYTFGLRLKPGVTAGNWLFYVPFDVTMSGHEVKFERDLAANNGYANNAATRFDNYTIPTGATGAGQTVIATYTLNDVVAAEGTTGTPETNTTFKKTKTRFQVAFGLGAAVKLTDQVSLDLSATYSPYANMTIDTPAYKSSALTDTTRLGNTYKIKVASFKATLGFTYHF